MKPPPEMSDVARRDDGNNTLPTTPPRLATTKRPPEGAHVPIGTVIHLVDKRTPREEGKCRRPRQTARAVTRSVAHETSDLSAPSTNESYKTRSEPPKNRKHRTTSARHRTKNNTTEHPTPLREPMKPIEVSCLTDTLCGLTVDITMRF